MKVRLGSKGKLLLMIAAVTVISTLALNTVLAGTLTTYLTKVAGIPISSDYKVSTTTVPPNTKVLNVQQSGQEQINFIRVKVVDSNALLNTNNEVTGFSVTINLKAPSSTDVKVSISIKLSDGSVVEASNTFTLDPGTSTVTVNLPSPLNPDDIVSINIVATPE